MSQSSAKSLSCLTNSLANASISRAAASKHSHKYVVSTKSSAASSAYAVRRYTARVPASSTPITSSSSSQGTSSFFVHSSAAPSSSSSNPSRRFHTSAYSSHQEIVAEFHHEPALLPRKGSPSSELSSELVESSYTRSSAVLQDGASSSTTEKQNGFDTGALFSSDQRSSWSQNGLPSFFGPSLNVSRKGNFVFRNGAYGIPKVMPDDPATDGIAATKKSLKGKEKATDVEEPEHPLSVSVGEDAYFVRSDSLGVADGVGGWSGHAGANPARWSRKLMHHCASELARYENVEDELFLRYYDLDPVDILQRAFEKSLSECREEGVIGSSTALLAVLRHDELRLANMGDCCCFIIRGSDFIFRSEEQQHSFNFPVQVGTSSKDTPVKDAQRFNIKVQKDDIVILSSDGLVDNLFDEDILEEVLRFVETSPPPQPAHHSSEQSVRPGQRFTLNRFSPQLVSEALCLRAKSVYEDQRAVASPFQQKALEEGIHFAGGKRDDVTTLVGVIGELEGSPDRR